MIEEFAVPLWVRLMARMTGRHLRRATGWSRRPDEPDPEQADAHPAGTQGRHADVGSRPRVSGDASSVLVPVPTDGTLASPVAEPLACTAATTLAAVTGEADTLEEPATAAGVPSSPFAFGTPNPADGVGGAGEGGLEGRLTHNLLAASRAMESRTRSLVAASLSPARPTPAAVGPAETELAESRSAGFTLAVVEPPAIEAVAAGSSETAGTSIGGTSTTGERTATASVASAAPAFDAGLVVVTTTAAAVVLPPTDESLGGEVPAAGTAANEPPAPPAPPPPAAAVTAAKSAASTVMGPAVRDEFNRTNLDYRRPMPRPKVRGRVVDFHCHLFALRHAADWFEAADHYGMDVFLTMTPLEEAVGLAREWGHRLRFNAVPSWGDASGRWVDNWRTRIEAFYNLGSRIAKFHASPGTMAMRGVWLDDPAYKPIFTDLKARGMAIMTHIGDPDTWYHGKYDPAKFGSRDDHYRMWKGLLHEHRGTPWVGAHLGGNPEDLPRLQRLLDAFPDLMLDCSATRWMVREVSARRDAAREFFVRNQDRILFGSDQVSGHDRQFDFLASRIWCHRKLWETAYTGPSPIIDPDLPRDQQPVVRGLALPDVVLQKIYHDNATKLLDKLGMGFDR